MTVFNEGVFREEFLNDPTLGVGVINYEVKEAGVFTEEEILNLFPEEGYGPWGSLLDDICFLLACTTGARRGEILALRWRSIDFGKGFITINEAWKSRNELGKAK